MPPKLDLEASNKLDASISQNRQEIQDLHQSVSGILEQISSTNDRIDRMGEGIMQFLKLNLPTIPEVIDGATSMTSDGLANDNFKTQSAPLKEEVTSESHQNQATALNC